MAGSGKTGQLKKTGSASVVPIEETAIYRTPPLIRNSIARSGRRQLFTTCHHNCSNPSSAVFWLLPNRLARHLFVRPDDLYQHPLTGLRPSPIHRRVILSGTLLTGNKFRKMTQRLLRALFMWNMAALFDHHEFRFWQCVM